MNNEVLLDVRSIKKGGSVRSQSFEALKLKQSLNSSKQPFFDKKKARDIAELEGRRRYRFKSGNSPMVQTSFRKTGGALKNSVDRAHLSPTIQSSIMSNNLQNTTTSERKIARSSLNEYPKMRNSTRFDTNTHHTPIDNQSMSREVTTFKRAFYDNPTGPGDYEL